MKHSIPFSLAAVLAVSTIVAAAGPVVLGSRYFDRAEGFSLRPPAGASRRTTASTKRIVIWWAHDPSSGAIAWTLGVLRAQEPNAPADLNEQAKILAERLGKQENFQIESHAIISVAGGAAVDLRGVTKMANNRMWQRQTWMPREEGKFLILNITGPQTAREQLNAIFQAVLDTVDLTDPPSLLAKRQDNLQRGQALLASLDGAVLAKTLIAEPQWFLFTDGGKDVGYMCILESPDRREGVEGFRVRTWTTLKLPSQPIRHAQSDMFCSTDRKTERWTESLSAGVGSQALVLEEQGERQDDVITCSLTRGDKQQTRRKVIPDAMRGQYVPKAVGMILVRLVDRKQARAYAFIGYTSPQDSFDVRTFVVGAAEEIAIGGKRLPSWRATDRLAEDAEEALLWLDEAGRLLRMQTPDGCVMEAASPREVIERFPEAAAIAKKATP